MEEQRDRSDYFMWQPGDLVPPGTAPTIEERREDLLARLPERVRKIVLAAEKKQRADPGDKSA